MTISLYLLDCRGSFRQKCRTKYFGLLNSTERLLWLIHIVARSRFFQEKELYNIGQLLEQQEKMLQELAATISFEDLSGRKSAILCLSTDQEQEGSFGEIN